ncbi:MAG: hypothetical protein ACRCSN_08220 [Dermatophilaceae bacterium]
MARVVITSRMPGNGLERIAATHELTYHDARGARCRGDLLAAVAGADALVCTLADRVDTELIGIVGPGQIGLATAPRARALGMRVLVSGRSAPGH